MNDIDIGELRNSAIDFVAAEPSNSNTEDYWRTPLLVSAPIDERFDLLPQIAFNRHMHPYDLLPTAKSLIVFFIPFKHRLVKENKKGDRPCHNWGLAYVQTNDLIGRLSRALKNLLTSRGFAVELTPATHNFNEDVLMARWSHKHLVARRISI